MYTVYLSIYPAVAPKYFHFYINLSPPDHQVIQYV